jgi:lipopolysaccharide export system protein LptC
MKHSKKLILTILFILAALVVLWMTSSKDIQDTFNDILNEQPALALYPISYLNNTQTQQYNEQGLLSYTLNAKIIRQFEVVDVSTPDLIINQPYLTIYGIDSDKTGANNNPTPEKTPTVNSNASLSTVSADLAEGFDSNEKLTLKGNVIVIQTLANGETSQLQTSILYLEPSRRYAQTDKPVIITDARGIINATGMKLFFDEQRIELLSSVVSRYSSR